MVVKTGDQASNMIVYLSRQAVGMPCLFGTRFISQCGGRRKVVGQLEVATVEKIKLWSFHLPRQGMLSRLPPIIFLLWLYCVTNYSSMASLGKEVDPFHSKADNRQARNISTIRIELLRIQARRITLIMGIQLVSNGRLAVVPEVECCPLKASSGSSCSITMTT